jgi:hypothetical protein
MIRCLFACAVLLPIANTAYAEPAQNSLVVHEWGIFRVNSDVDFANADMRAEWDNLPEFVYGHIKGRVVPQHWGAVEIRKRPIIFFHAAEPMTARVKIDFPGGMPGVWYPATINPAVFGGELQPKTGTSLEWSLGIKQLPQGWRPKQATGPAVSEKHCFARLRQVQCDEIFAAYSENPVDVEREKFLYYDGLFPQGKWLKVGVDKDRVTLTSQVRAPVFDVTVVDRRSDKLVRIGRIAKLESGETIRSVAFEDIEAPSFAAQASGMLLKQLVAARLYEDEASSLVDLWRKDLFETPGLHLFFRLSQAEYESRMPMTIGPLPKEVVRVGLVFQGHLEPDFAERILELVKQFDSARFADRDAAMKKLLQIGPAALVQIQKLRGSRDLSVEVRERIDVLIKKWNAKEGFDQ